MNCRLCNQPLTEGTSAYDVGRHSTPSDCKRVLLAEIERLRSELEGAVQQRDRNEVHGRDLKHENGVLRKCVVSDVLPFLLLVQDKEEYPNDEAYALRLKLQRILGITKDWRDDIRKEPPH